MKEKVICITGSSKGIGEATAYLFAKESAKLVITFFSDKTEGEKVVKTCIELGSPEVLLVHLDVTDPNSAKNAVKKIVDTFGKIDVLINNAGVCNWNTFEELTPESIHKEIATNVEGVIQVTHAAFPYIKDMVISIGSQMGLRDYDIAASYCASKWAVRGFTKTLANEYQNLIFYTVNPIGTATRMNDFSGMKPEKVGEVMVQLAKGELKKESGADINMWEV